MNNRINTKNILFLVLCFIQYELLAQESWVNFIDLDPAIHTGNNLTEEASTHIIYVLDEKFGTTEWAAIEKTHQVQNRVIFEVAPTAYAPETVVEGSYNIEVKIEFWKAADDPNGSPCATCTTNELLTVDFSPTEKQQITTAFKQYEGAHKMKITLLNASPLANAPPLRLRGEIMVHRLYNFNCEDSPTGLSGNTNDDHFFNLTWNAFSGANEYDVEWTFYHRDSEVGQFIETGTGAIEPNFDFLFRNNTTRVNVEGTTPAYKINLLYPTGYLFYRVRATILDTATNIRNYSGWSSDLLGNRTLTTFSDKSAINWHENEELNFQASVAFAEAGKNVPSVQYFDGTLRQRQSAVLSNADDRTTLTEIFYDHHGRPAVQSMPAPTTNNILAFKDNFSLNLTGQPYNRSHFDEGDCDVFPQAMSNAAGAAQYYSDQNPLKNTGKHQYIPDAEGYPFTVTEYTPDLTGRVRKQSGVGATFKIGNGKTTNYYYDKPLQVELDRLFGNDVGNSSHYLKNVVADPNGQKSVSYLDAHGRVIATALAGEQPGNVATLANYEAPQQMPNDLLNNQDLGFALISTEKFTVVTPEKYTFDYTLTDAEYQQVCSNLCYDCVYELNISISDGACNVFNEGVPFDTLLTNFTFSEATAPTPCGNGNIALHFDLPDPATDTPLLKLPEGDYTVTKILRYSQEAFDLAADHFMANNTCIPSLQTLIDDYKAAVDISGCDMTCADCIAETGDPAACQQFCELPTECETIYDLMQADITPGGQYAGLATDVTSIFHLDGTDYTSIPTDAYLNAAGEPDRIYDENGLPVPPQAISVDLFIRNFKSTWTDTLVKYLHPEYCVYVKWCLNNTASDEWDKDLEAHIGDYQAAANEGTFFEIVNNEIVLKDPYFLTEPGLSCQQEMEDRLSNIHPTEVISLNDFAVTTVLGDCSYTHGSGTVEENNLIWELYVSNYLGIKQQLLAEKREADTTCPQANCIGQPAPCNGQNPNPYENKLTRFTDFSRLKEVAATIPIPGEAPITEAEAIAIGVAQAAVLTQTCQTDCMNYADSWLAQLSPCSLSTGQLNAIRAELIAVCESSCNQYPFEGYANTPSLDNSFPQVLMTYIATYELDCNPYSIQNIAPSYSYRGPSVVTSIVNNCACTELNAMETLYNANKEAGESLATFLGQFSNFALTAAQLSLLQNKCTGTTGDYTLANSFQIPAYLDCETCKTYAEVLVFVTAFNTKVATTHEDYYDLLALALNHDLGFNLTAEDYYNFLQCGAGQSTLAGYRCNTNPILCPSIPDPETPDENPCTSALYEQATANAYLRYQALVDSLRNAFMDEYRTKCTKGILNGTINETFTTLSNNHEYHYTLYYYDQAGNLVQTVPPNGVQLLTNTADLAAIKAHRDNPNNAPVYPSHQFLTQYKYNTLNQVSHQISPDTKEKRFWYDRIGRLVASQDGRQLYTSMPDQAGNYAQRATPFYSYTIYDPIGRIIEVGELATTQTMTDAKALVQADFDTWLASGTKTEVTRTFYDDTPFSIPAFDNGQQTELRTRVAAVTFKEVDTHAEPYDYATHYSYDITGNVKTLVQEIYALHTIGIAGDPQTDQGFKRVDYDYDYISGNVNVVYYQKGKADQFTHHYTYDSNNRLTQTKTSAIETNPELSLWDRDATYDYYLHGPLARSELGENRVQGCDYAYTLQGWIKGVNSSGLVPSKDIGQDGYDGNTVGRDVLGYTLGYFEGDYQSISGQQFEMNTSGSTLNTESKNLYNGNIRYMSIHNQQLGDPIAYSYQYDQLHRIKAMNSIQNADLTAYGWNNSGNTSDYAMTANYDGNGNIQALTRKGILANTNTSSTINNLAYTYQLGTNKLRSTTESANGASQTDTYIYDGNGNMVENADGAMITWSPYGKVKKVDVSAAGSNGNNSTNIVIDQPITQNEAIIACETITGSNTVNGSSTVIFTAGQSITLLPGFSVSPTNGGSFMASISPPNEPCDPPISPQETNFGYDAAQNRVLKSVAKNGIITKTYYIRDAQGNMLATYQLRNDSLLWKEQHLYGSSRLGIFETGVKLDTTTKLPYYVENNVTIRGKRLYELSNHLGNVLTVIRDYTYPVGNPADPDFHFSAFTESAADYYPFGLEMSNRSYKNTAFGSDTYRFGFNGKEVDRNGEWGSSAHYDYGFRIYNPSIGRFLSTDPLTASYPYWSPFQFASNSPISSIDLDGLESKIAFQAKVQYKPVFKKEAGSFGQRLGNSAHNIMAVPSNILINTENGAYGVWNFGVDLFAGEYNKITGTDVMMRIDGTLQDAIKNEVDYRSETPISQQVADAGNSFTDLKNYELAGEVALGFYLGGNALTKNAGKLSVNKPRESKIGNSKTAGKSPVNHLNGRMNCFDCFEQGDRILAGTSWSPVPKKGVAPDGVWALNRRLGDLFGTSISKTQRVSQAELVNILLEGGDGTRGGIMVKNSNGSHIVNVINRKGNIEIYDFQKGADTLDGALLSRNEQQRLLSGSEIHFVNTTNVTY